MLQVFEKHTLDHEEDGTAACRGYDSDRDEDGEESARRKQLEKLEQVRRLRRWENEPWYAWIKSTCANAVWEMWIYWRQNFEDPGEIWCNQDLKRDVAKVAM